MGNALALKYRPEITPDPNKETAFDPMYGFPSGRKERAMVATVAEMESAKLDLEDRDYCAHLLISYNACRKEVWPWVYQCGHEKHEYQQCEYEDYVLRLKEYERERRLMERAQRIAKKQQSAA